MITIDRKAAAKRIEDAEQIPVFELDDEQGKKQTYSIPRVERAELTLNYASVVAEKGEAAGNAYMLIEMFGQEAFDALRAVRGLTDEELSEIVDAVTKVIAPKSNPKGRRG